MTDPAQESTATPSPTYRPGASAAERAYEAYRVARAGLAHNGAALPAWDAVAPTNQLAWNSFAAVVMAGGSSELAYSRGYLGATAGLTVSGTPAPAWIYFELSAPSIAAAWNAARAAVLGGP